MLEDVKEDQKGDCCTPILTECVVLSSCTSSGFNTVQIAQFGMLLKSKYLYLLQANFANKVNKWHFKLQDINIVGFLSAFDTSRVCFKWKYAAWVLNI